MLKILRHLHKSINNFRTKWKIKNRRHGGFLSTFGMGHRVVPPTFHKIRVFTISSKSLGIFQRSPHYPRIFSSSLQVNILSYFSPLELSEIYTFMGFPLKSCALRLHPGITASVRRKTNWCNSDEGLALGASAIVSHGVYYLHQHSVDTPVSPSVGQSVDRLINEPTNNDRSINRS